MAEVPASYDKLTKASHLIPSHDWLWFLHWKPGGLMDIIESKHAVMRRCVWPGQLYCISDKWQGHHGFMLLSCLQIFSEPPRSSMFSFLARWRGQGLSHHRSDWACLPWDLSAPIFSEVSAVQCRVLRRNLVISIFQLWIMSVRQSGPLHSTRSDVADASCLVP